MDALDAIEDRAAQVADEDAIDLNAPIEEVNAELRAAGFDPTEVASRGAAVASQLLKKRRGEETAND